MATTMNRPARERTAAGKVESLLNPRKVVIVGASDRPGNWSQKVFRNLERYGFSGAIYPVNPQRDEVWGRRCYRTIADLPEPPDHAIVLVPAPHVADALRAAAAAGARSATVHTSGFEEVAEAQAQARARSLRAVIEETGLAVSGPNCLGNMAARFGLMSMTDERPTAFRPGPVAIIGQSGGLTMGIKRRLEERGLDAGYLISSGNETGLKTADYIRFFAEVPDVRVVVSYLESVRNPADFLESCRYARARGTSVVVVKLGATEAGRAAAMAHTGALAGAIEAFDTIAGAAGAIRVDNLDDVVEVTDYLLHLPPPAGPRLGAITFSGGLRGLLLDGAARAGVRFPPLSPPTLAKLSDILGVGTILGNPLDAGFTALSSQKAYLETIRALLDDPEIDALILQEEVPRFPGSEGKEDNLRKVNAMVEAGVPKPVAFFSMISHGFTDYARDMRATVPRLAFLQEVDQTLRAVRTLADHARRVRAGDRIAAAAPSSPPDGPALAKLRSLAMSGGAPSALNESDSKAVLAAYGIAAPPERIAADAEQAVAAARAIGYPVVLKALSAAIAHKSDAGAVRLGLADDDAVRAAFAEIARNVATCAPEAALDGMLVCRQAPRGLELVLGIENDPEMGCVVMVGSGGVLLELVRDVAFGPPLLDRAMAEAMIGETRVGRLLDGYRGGAVYDRNALVDALVAMGRIAHDLGDAVRSIDVNPFVVLPAGQGGFALDALVVAGTGG
jgi:acetyltransferase